MQQKMRARRQAGTVGEIVVVMSCEGPFTAIEANGKRECKGRFFLSQMMIYKVHEQRAAESGL